MEINNILQKTPILLPCPYASSGITISQTEYVAVDGITPCVYIFSLCGMYKGAFQTLRVYRKIVYNHENNNYYAIGSPCSSDIYVLNSRFEETDTISLCEKQITDISISDGHLIITTPARVLEYQGAGSDLKTIFRAKNHMNFQSFAKHQNIQVMTFTKENGNYIAVYNEETEFFTQISHTITFKNLFTTDGGGIWGFFSKNYMNNFILPIYEADKINFNNMFELITQM